ncbi:hypothetical protein DPMN_084343 [Dreissena polymorpha]|uniref:Uncharacterized protein n=1 Tax=Dreissena polymorpha TaxID=45954 RepID=A0A9D4BKS3_DREPO|nr:hypothetical protein DPMN_084343 [Dreissena polymorpha]
MSQLQSPQVRKFRSRSKISASDGSRNSGDDEYTNRYLLSLRNYVHFRAFLLLKASVITSSESRQAKCFYSISL